VLFFFLNLYISVYLLLLCIFVSVSHYSIKQIQYNVHMKAKAGAWGCLSKIEISNIIVCASLCFVYVSHISHAAQSCVTFANVMVKLINVALTINANNMSRPYPYAALLCNC